MNNKMDMQGLISMLSNMDKTELESGMNKLSKMLNSKDADKIIDQIKNQTNNN